MATNDPGFMARIVPRKSINTAMLCSSIVVQLSERRKGSEHEGRWWKESRDAKKTVDDSPNPLFALEIRVRGRADVLHQEVCDGLEDAIRIGEKWFRAFERRNPWFVQDSKRNRIFILLDPETQALLEFVT